MAKQLYEVLLFCPKDWLLITSNGSLFCDLLVIFITLMGEKEHNLITSTDAGSKVNHCVFMLCWQTDLICCMCSCGVTQIICFLIYV